MKVTKSVVDTAVVWCIFCNCFSTDIYKDVIFVDAQKLKVKERDLKYRLHSNKHPYFNPKQFNESNIVTHAVLLLYQDCI